MWQGSTLNPPPPDFVINHGNYFSSRLAAYVYDGRGDLIQGVSPYGPGLEYPRGVAVRMPYHPAHDRCSITGTMLCGVTFNSWTAAAFPQMAGLGYFFSGGADRQDFSLYQDGGAANRISVNLNLNNSGVPNTPYFSVTSYPAVVNCGLAVNGTTVSLIAPNVLRGSVSVSASSWTASFSQSLDRRKTFSVGSGIANSMITHWCALFTTFLSSTEAAAFFANPYQVLMPPSLSDDDFASTTTGGLRGILSGGRTGVGGVLSGGRL